MKIESITELRDVTEASGVTRHGERLLIVSDADPGAYHSFSLAAQPGTIIELPAQLLVRHELAGGSLAVDFESIDVLADGRIVALSERLRSIIDDRGIVVQYDDPFSELGERGLEGLAVRSQDSGRSEVVVLWEGGPVEDSEVLLQVRERLGAIPFSPVALTHFVEPEQRNIKVKVEHDAELVVFNVPLPDADPRGWRFRAPDLVWHKYRAANGGVTDGFILLLSSQLQRPRAGKQMFGPCWLQRFDLSGNPVGEHLDMDTVAKELRRDDLVGANWEGLGWYEENKKLIVVHDKSKRIVTPVALIVDLQHFWPV